MIGIDTNVLLRLVLRDDTEQFSETERLFRNRCTAEAPAFISCVVLCEFVWVLARAEKRSRFEIADLVGELIEKHDVRFEDEALVRNALAVYRTGRTDFVDVLIGLRNRHLGCTTTATFDEAAALLSTFDAVRDL